MVMIKWNISLLLKLFIEKLISLHYAGQGRLNELGSWITYNSYKPITNTAWVLAQFFKLQERVHSTRSRKW